MMNAHTRNLASTLKIKIFADEADPERMIFWRDKPYIRGFTTNPTLMRKAGIANYESFAKLLLQKITDLPISFEVFSDELSEMEDQARCMAAWGSNVCVKIPVTNTRGEFTGAVIKNLCKDSIALNITAVMTLKQVERIVECVDSHTFVIISIFAGRIADTGRDPIPFIREALHCVRHKPNIEILWASPREVLNIYQADEVGCHIITVTPDLLKKLSLMNKNLDEYSLETVKMFYDDARAAHYHINLEELTVG